MEDLQLGTVVWLAWHKFKLARRVVGRLDARALLVLLSFVGSIGFLFAILSVDTVSDGLWVLDGDAIARMKSDSMLSLRQAFIGAILLFIYTVPRVRCLLNGHSDLEILLVSPIRPSVVVCGELLGGIFEFVIPMALVYTPAILVFLCAGAWQVLGSYIFLFSLIVTIHSTVLTLAYLLFRQFGLRSLDCLYSVCLWLLVLEILISLAFPLSLDFVRQIPGLQSLLQVARTLLNWLLQSIFLEPFPTLVCVGLASLSLVAATRIITPGLVTTIGSCRDRPSNDPQKSLTA